MNTAHSLLKPALKQAWWIVSMLILGVLTLAAYLIGFALNILCVILGGFTIMSAASDRSAKANHHHNAFRRTRG